MSLIDKTYFLYPPCEIPITDSSNGYSSSLVEKENTRIALSINIYEREYLKLILYKFKKEGGYFKQDQTFVSSGKG